MRIAPNSRQRPEPNATPDQDPHNLTGSQISRTAFRGLGNRRIQEKPHETSNATERRRELLDESRIFNFDRWYEKYNRLVAAIVHERIADYHRAEDVIQIVWQKLDTVGHRYDPKIAKETTFISVITKRAVIDELRRGKNRPRCFSGIPERPGDDQDLLADNFSAPNPLIPDELNRRDEVGLVLALIKSLDPKKREILEAFYIQGLTLTQIAEVRGMPIGSVKSLLSRGLAQLRQEFEEEINPR